MTAPAASPVPPGGEAAVGSSAGGGALDGAADGAGGGPGRTTPLREATSGRSRRRELLGALLVYLMLAYLFTSATWQDPSNRWVGACCDQEQSIWFLAWSPTALELGQNPLLTDRVNAPDGANLMWNGSIPLLALLFSPLTRAAGPIFTYNVAVVLAIALSGLAAFFALRRYSAGGLGALVGGAVYAFSPYVASHTLLHLNLINVWAPPLFLVLLDELLVRRRYRPALLGALLGVLGAIQLVTFEEVLATSAVAGLVLVVVAAVVVRRRAAVLTGLRRLAIAAVPGLATFLVLAAFPLAVQFLGPQQIHGQVQPPAEYSMDLANLVLPTDYTLLAPKAITDITRAYSRLHHEATGYLGLPLLLVLGWVVVDRRRDRRVVVAAVTGLVLLVLALGPQLTINTVPQAVPMPWSPIAELPLLEHVLPGRITLYAFLAVAVLVAIAVDHAASLGGRRAAARLAVIGIALVFIVPAPAKSSTTTVPAFFRSWDSQGIADDELILFAPWFTNGAGADPMLWAAFAEAKPRMYEGYVYVPGADGRPRYGPPAGPLARMMIEIQDNGTALTPSEADRSGAVAELRASRVTTVMVGSLRYRDEMVALFTDLFGRSPEEREGVALWRDVDAWVATQ